jgi:hypothetical protein
MITYNNNIRRATPITDSLLAEAKADMTKKSPYSYPSQHQDILNAKGLENAANLQHSAEKANTDYDLQYQRAQYDLSAAGLQQMASAQQQQRQNEAARQGAMLNAYSGLLTGLFN